MVSCDFGAGGEYTMAVFFQDCGKDDSGSMTFVEDDIAVMSKEAPVKEALGWLKGKFPDVVFSVM